MLMQRNVMNAACISMSGSEAFCEESFTNFIIDPFGGPGECTYGDFVVEPPLTQSCVQFVTIIHSPPWVGGLILVPEG